MERIEKCFLQALRASIEGRQVEWQEKPDDWDTLFTLAQSHHVLPMIVEAVYPALADKPELLQELRWRTMQMVMAQMRRTGELLALLPRLTAAGVTPLVVKGIVCRELYPSPDDRISGDEDVLIPPEQFELCHKVLTECGMEPAEPEQDIESAYEVPYGKKGSPLYIELHKYLFPPKSGAYGDLNRYFEQAWQRSVRLTVQGVEVPTLGHTDHLFYLICHAFKHFLHSGVGIRQICDIVLYANRFGAEIDWDYVLTCCREIRAEQFAAALFRIGERYLTFAPEQACWPQAWQDIPVDEEPLLLDLLEAGVYGNGTMSRKHSSTITLNAVEAEKQGRAGSGLLRTIFPPAEQLKGRYPWLEQHPYLLPAAWGDRILHYRRETTSAGAENSAAESLRIGGERVELLKQYGVIHRSEQ